MRPAVKIWLGRVFSRSFNENAAKIINIVNEY